MQTRKFWLAILLCALLGTLLAFGQAMDGNLVGIITDKSGAALVGATVELTNQATNTKQTTKTASDGSYRFSNLLVGLYKLTATQTGFTTASVANLQVELSRQSTVNVTLEVGNVATTVEVSDSAAAIDTTTANIVQSFSASQAQQLPVTGVGTLGVINLSLLGSGVSSSGGVGYGTGPSVGGQRPTNNNFMVEGIDTNNRSVTGPLLAISNEAVQEFSLQQNQFSSEFGHSTGGQFNSVIKSGSNSLHGAASMRWTKRNAAPACVRCRVTTTTALAAMWAVRCSRTSGSTSATWNTIRKARRAHLPVRSSSPRRRASACSKTIRK